MFFKAYLTDDFCDLDQEEGHQAKEVYECPHLQDPGDLLFLQHSSHDQSDLLMVKFGMVTFLKNKHEQVIIVLLDLEKVIIKKAKRVIWALQGLGERIQTNTFQDVPIEGGGSGTGSRKVQNCLLSIQRKWPFASFQFVFTRLELHDLCFPINFYLLFNTALWDRRFI